MIADNILLCAREMTKYVGKISLSQILSDC